MDMSLSKLLEITRTGKPGVLQSMTSQRVRKDASGEDINKFLTNVAGRISSRNIMNPQQAITYKYGIAYNEGENAASVTDMIKISAQRVHKKS